MRRIIASAAALAAVTLLALARPAEAQNAPRRPPLFLVDASGGLSLRETPLTFTVADVLAGSLRVGVPLRYGIEPWVAGGVADLRHVACAQGTTDCSDMEKRLLLGAMYQFGARGDESDGEEAGGPGGAYFGVGLGVRTFRGTSELAHSIVIGLPLASSSALAPVLELRSESYHGFSNELLIVAVGLRAGLGIR